MRIFALTIAALSLAGCGRTESASRLDEAWDGVNDPLNLSSQYTTSFTALPASGALQTVPWSDTYWPSNEGGIDSRWQGGGPLFRPGLFRLRNMNQQKIARMSPAEKYDAYIGDFSYSLHHFEQQRTSPFEQSWHGICHGWAPASMLFAEPGPVTVTSADGVAIPFGASDVKALLSYYQGQVANSRAYMLGGRCNYDLSRDPSAAQRAECRDVNAGAFHIVLANELGLMREGLVMDADPSEQIWNQPIYSFRSAVTGSQGPSPGSAPSTVRELRVRTDVTYVVEVQPQWDRLGPARTPTETKSYAYTLELDAQDRIIGGAWLSADHPDFLWKQDRPAFTGHFAALAGLYQASVAQ